MLRVLGFQLFELSLSNLCLLNGYQFVQEQAFSATEYPEGSRRVSPYYFLN